MRKNFSVFIILLLISILPLSRAKPASANLYLAEQIIYADDLAPGWSDWSWASVDFQALSPVHSGIRSIAVTYDAWQGLYLHYPELPTTGFSHLRFFIHGGSQGGQEINLYVQMMVNGEEVEGPRVSLQPPISGTWSEVLVPLDELGANTVSLTGIIWQDATGGPQAPLYLDDIALTDLEDPQGPALTQAELWPRASHVTDPAGSVARVRVTDPQGFEDITSVTLDANQIGCGLIPLYDDGRSLDDLAGDGIYGGFFTVCAGVSAGEKSLLVTAVDQAGHQSSLSLGTFVVLEPVGMIPPVLPQHIGWGSNAWSETPGEDWQVNSGVPWDYVYQYITYEWYRDGWGGNFVNRFVNQAWNKGYIPVVTVYMMLGLPPECGEGPECYTNKLQNAEAVQTYLAALQEAARQSQGSGVVIINLEPDFYGYMQQYSNRPDRPPHVIPDDPASYPVSLNMAGYPNNLAGFGRRMVDVFHETAPNALVAPMASMWATNGDPQSVPSTTAVEMGRRTAAFIDAMGGAQADLLVVEWSDRDAGSGLRPWWDDTDQTPPRPTRAFLWENALAHTSGKRLLLWQMPVGNMSLDDTCDHYRDNRAAYAFNHMRALFELGVVGILFGGGADCMTQVWSDGGFVAAQGAVTYAAPASPEKLMIESVNDPSVALKWQVNHEFDLWHYKVRYSLVSGGFSVETNAGKRQTLEISTPFAGDWQIQVVAYDALGIPSQPSEPVFVTTSAGAPHTLLPLVYR